MCFLCAMRLNLVVPGNNTAPSMARSAKDLASMLLDNGKVTSVRLSALALVN
jgi:hypothetical protein